MKITKILNFALFQIGWIIAVYYHDNLSAIFCLLLALLNFRLSDHANLKALLVSICVAMVGLANDYAIFKAGFIDFADQNFYFMPLWLVALWMLFVSTLDSSMAWILKLQFRYLAPLSGLGGALSYIAGAKLGALTYQATSISAFAFHFLNWFFLLPLIVYLHKKLFA